MADRSSTRRTAPAATGDRQEGAIPTTVTGAAAEAPAANAAGGETQAASAVETTARDAASRHPAWAFATGAIFGGITLIFFMALVLLAAFDRPIPCESRFLVVVVLALGGALASSFIGGSAAAKGEIPLRIATRNPIGFSVVGGIAVLLLLMVVGYFGYESSCNTPPAATDSAVEGTRKG